MKIVSSWSGGKDSCLACYRAMRTGYEVVGLLNFISRKYQRGCFHGISAELLGLQASAIGLPLMQHPVSDNMAEYEREFKDAVRCQKKDGIEGIVFGDIYLDEHKEWVDRVCGDLRVTAVEPLWELSPVSIAREFIDVGFRAVIVSCKADILGDDIVGRVYDLDMVEYLEGRGICPCGENGEFHTFVTDGPIFSSRIDINTSSKVLKGGIWEHWFLDIEEYSIV